MAASARQYHVWVGAESGALKGAVGALGPLGAAFGHQEGNAEQRPELPRWGGGLLWDRRPWKTELFAGGGLCRMRQDPTRPQRLGTAGKENGLKVWDLQQPGGGPLFRAKNVPNDWLDLRVPIWDRDFCFVPGTEQLLTCTAYGQVRLYDSATPRRRPVLQVTYGEGPLTALALAPGGTSVVVGSARGDMAVIDLRQGRLLKCLKGIAGSVRGLQCHPSLPLVASCGLDRFLRLHNLDDKRLLHKVYLKSRLNCLLLSSCQDLEAEDAPPPAVKEEEEDGDALWDSMETISARKRAPKRKSSGL